MMKEKKENFGKSIQKKEGENQENPNNLLSNLRHLCFNITEKGHMIVQDWYNRILNYARKYCKNSVFSKKIAWKSDSIFSSLYILGNL